MTPPVPESPSAPESSGPPGRRQRILRSVRATATAATSAVVPTLAPPAPVQASPVQATARQPTPTPVAASTPRAGAPVHPDVTRTTERVEQLRSQWARCGADIAGRLRPGVEEARLDEVERRLGLSLPVAARTWWRLVDGVEPVRSRYRTSAPTVGPGGWVPLGVDDAVRRATGQGPGPGVPPGLLPLFARDEELIAVRLGTEHAQVEQLVLADDGEGYQHGWRVDLDLLLGTWAGSFFAAVHWLPDAQDWVVDPFAVQALPNAYLLD